MRNLAWKLLSADGADGFQKAMRECCHIGADTTHEHEVEVQVEEGRIPQSRETKTERLHMSAGGGYLLVGPCSAFERRVSFETNVPSINS